MAGNLRVGIFGVNGKMGTQVCRAVGRADGLEVVAGVDLGDPVEEAARSQVTVDFTHPGVVMEHIKWCIDNGIHCVVGTSGFTPDRIEQVRDWLGDDPSVGVLIASNFSIGAVLMMKFAEQAARFYPSVEVVELHHPTKLDAPSGTAMTTAERIAAARKDAGLGPVPDATEGDESARGADIEGIRVHAVRLQGLVAHQEVLLGAMGETLSIRHDSYDRASFMPGVVAAIRYVVKTPGLTLGIDSVLGI